MLRFGVLAFALALTGCAENGGEAAAETAAQAAALEVEYFRSESTAGRNLPFSDAVRVGRMLYVSGQIGTDSTGALVTGGIGPETRQTMENIRAELERHGLTMDNVVKCLAMVADISEWGAMNEVYRTYFTKNLPSRSAFGANGLALGARIELECWAVFP
mgnify:CR=1 FL=1